MSSEAAPPLRWRPAEADRASLAEHRFEVASELDLTALYGSPLVRVELADLDDADHVEVLRVRPGATSHEVTYAVMTRRSLPKPGYVGEHVRLDSSLREGTRFVSTNAEHAELLGLLATVDAATVSRAVRAALGAGDVPRDVLVSRLAIASAPAYPRGGARAVLALGLGEEVAPTELDEARAVLRDVAEGAPAEWVVRRFAPW